MIADRGRSAGRGGAALLALALLAAGCQSLCTPSLAPADPAHAGRIDAWLTEDYLDLSESAPVMALVFTFPGADDEPGSLSLRVLDDGTLQPEGLRPHPPSEVLAQEGFHLGLFDTHREAPLYLGTLGQIHVVRGEGHADGFTDFGVVHQEYERGAVAVRFPFVADATLTLFEVTDQESVGRVFVWLPLGPDLPPLREVDRWLVQVLP